MKKLFIAILSVLLLSSFLISFYAYPSLPEKVAIHWNINGEADGYSGKSFGAFFMPVLLLVLVAIFLATPYFDTFKGNIKSFIFYYYSFIIVFSSFMIAAHLQILGWSLGYRISPLYVISIGAAALFYSIGELCKHSKRNWFIGIRTPWTMSDDKIWDKTNKLSGKLFKISAILSLLGAFSQAYSVWLTLAPVIVFMLYTAGYSYFLYRKTNKNSKK